MKTIAQKSNKLKSVPQILNTSNSQVKNGMETPKIRIKEHIGIVTNETSTTHINFLISPLKNKITVEKTDYVILDHPTQGETSQILAEVTEVKGYEEVVGTTVNDKNAGNLIATAHIIGYINLQQQNKPIQPLLTPPNPGSRIYLPYVEFLEDTFTRDNNGETYPTPIQIGTLTATATTTNDTKKPINYFLNADTLAATHTLITGTANTGKTHIAKTLAAEIANKTQTAITILDAYGEYTTLKETTNKPTHITTLNPNDKTQETPAKTVKPNQTTILNAENLTPQEKHTALTQCLDALWQARLKKTIPPLLLIIENADTLKTATLETLAYEGTKHGIALMLTTKHPTELGGKILSQLNTQIMGRTTDKDDLNYLNPIAMDKALLLPQLKQDEWIINSSNNAQPMQIRTK
jgi:DNA helicase HerA-like ATPase